MAGMSEAAWEQIVLDLLAEPHGWQPVHGEKIAPGAGEGARESISDLLIRPRLLTAMQRLNPQVPANYLAQAIAEITTARSTDPIEENRRVHGILVHGYRLTYIDADLGEVNETVRVLSTNPAENEWLVANQVQLRQGDKNRRFDVVLFVNGMPLSIIELKSAMAAAATSATAHAQLETYVREFPLAFRFCVLTLASDGLTALYGTPFTPLNHFAPWNVDDNGHPLDPDRRDERGDSGSALEGAIDGLYNPERFLQLLRNYVAFDEGEHGLVKRIAKPHQYFAVAKAVGATVHALDSNGKAGVVWHTQGSGKSMEMELYTAQIARHPRLKNPTVIVITDRTELDGQLFNAFNMSLLLPEKPRQIKTRTDLRESLTQRVTGGIFFTTLQKFGRTDLERESGAAHPLLSDRRNIIVVVDEAHRSHYDDLDGYARHLRDALPNATLIAFTGTPISQADRNTREVFGDYIDIYDLSRAVDDGATVPVAFEPRLIDVSFVEGLTQEQIDAAADEATLGLDESERQRIEASVAVVNAVYGAPERIAALADDLLTHWRGRREAMHPFIEAPGKALIVAATREIAVRIYDAIIEREPTWHSDALDAGRVKVVFSGSASDPEHLLRHVRRASQNDAIKARLKDADDELELVIVQNMMLTGFDAPPLHTLYLDRPLKGALLMQTLARVNRTFRGKQDGLLVAYAPVVDNLAAALAEYSPRDQAERPVGRPAEEAAAVARELVGSMRSLLDGFDWRSIAASGLPKAYYNAARQTADYVRQPGPLNDVSLGDERLSSRFRRVTGALARAWAIASGRESLADLHFEIAFYQDVRVIMAKLDAADRQASGEPVPEEAARLLGQLIATSTGAGEVIDIYEAAGIERPQIGQISPEFIAKAQQSSTPHLAIEALRATLLEEVAVATRGNLTRSRAFSERLAELMNRYTNQQLTAAEVLAELVEHLKQVHEEGRRGERFNPPLGTDELAFLDAASQNDAAVLLMGEDTLAQIARELVLIMRRDVRTDWTVREDVRAKLRKSIKRLLVKYRYPPDKQEDAVKLVIEQMEELAPRYAAELAG